jgi:hypothetical protein
MKIQIRTKDNLVELLKKGISHAWRVNKGRLNSIAEVEIYDFSGKAKISGTFDRENSQILENGRVAVAFKDGKIEQADFKWVGQNPIKYQSSTNEVVELMEDEVESDDENYFSFYLDHIGETSIDDKYRLKLSKPYFQNLLKHINFICVTFANSEEAIDEYGGDDYYRVLYDIKNNQILPLNFYELKRTDKSKETIFSAYTESRYADIPSTYTENEDYWGTWTLTNRIEGKDWEISFHGGYEGSYGQIEENLLNEIIESFNSKEVLTFISDVLNRIINF